MAGEPRTRGRNVITGRLKNEEGFTRESPINHDSGKASVIQLDRELKVKKSSFKHVQGKFSKKELITWTRSIMLFISIEKIARNQL